MFFIANLTRFYLSIDFFHFIEIIFLKINKILILVLKKLMDFAKFFLLDLIYLLNKYIDINHPIIKLIMNQ